MFAGTANSAPRLLLSIHNGTMEMDAWLGLMADEQEITSAVRQQKFLQTQRASPNHFFLIHFLNYSHQICILTIESTLWKMYILRQAVMTSLRIHRNPATTAHARFLIASHQ